MDQSGLVTKHFNSINDYDTCNHYVVPWNDEIQNTIYRDSLTHLSLKVKPRTKVLDFGVGTGSGASLFLLSHKSSTLFGVDSSYKMLEKARKNLSSNNLLNRAELLETDFTRWAPESKRFDFAFSAIAIHNATHSGKKAAFRNIYKALKPGGVFINGDFVLAESKMGDIAWRRYYEAYMRGYLSGGELKAWLHHAFVQDKPAKLSEQKEWLNEIGFKEFGVLWQRMNLAIYFAKK